MKKFKKVVALVMVCCMMPAVPCMARAEDTAATEAEAEFTAMPVMEVEFDEANPDYATLFEAEVYNYKLIRNLEAAYEAESFDAYFEAGNGLLSLNPEELDDAAKEMIIKVYNLRKELIQLRSVEDTIWYIWGEDMPVEDEASIQYEFSHFDNADFEPYLVPYMLEDQSEVKGNLILVSGGGFQTRSNDGEGFPAAHKFNELGYNCFLLQRRVEPYAKNDAFADLQRSLRYLRYHQEELGLGGTDKWVAVGWSGGAATVLGTVANFYGDIQPTTYDTDYVPDEIDAVNSDFDVVIPVYGGSLDDDVENENLPAMFISVGTEDSVELVEGAVELFETVKDKTEAELHLFSQNRHGYGIGTANTNSGVWPELADQFIQQSVTLRKDDTEEVCADITFGEIPDKYTKMQKIDNCYAGFGTADVTVAVNDDETAYFMFYEAYGEQVVLGGIISNGVLNNRYDNTGMFNASVNYIWKSVDSTAWVPVE